MMQPDGEPHYQDLPRNSFGARIPEPTLKRVTILAKERGMDNDAMVEVLLARALATIAHEQTQKPGPFVPPEMEEEVISIAKRLGMDPQELVRAALNNFFDTLAKRHKNSVK